MAPMTSEPRSDEHGMRPTSAVFDQDRAEAAVRELLIAIGEDPDRHGLIDTPARVARAYKHGCAALFLKNHGARNAANADRQQAFEMVKVKQVQWSVEDSFLSDV